MNKTPSQTSHAPGAGGTHAQAVRAGATVYLSGQIPLDPKTMELVNATIEDEIHQVFKNLRAVALASGGKLADVAKLNVFLTDLAHFPKVNEIMIKYFPTPFPARAPCVNSRPAVPLRISALHSAGWHRRRRGRRSRAPAES